MRTRGSGSLFRPRWKRAGWKSYRQSKLWWWKSPTGQRMPTGCVRKADADRWVNDRLAEMGRGGVVGHAQRPITYEDGEQMLLDRLEADQRRSVPVVKCRLAYLRAAFAGWRLADITPARATTYGLSRVRDGAAVATANASLAWLGRILRLAHESGRLSRAPVVHRLSGARRRTGTLDAHTFEAIVAALPERFRAPVRVLWLTGWRLREVTELSWSEVDMQACVLRLPAARSKNGKGRELCFAGSELETVLKAQRTLSPWVFPGRSLRPIHRTSVEKAWRAACQSQAVPGQPLLHDLRRSMATSLSAAGVPLATAQELLGHSDLKTHLGYVVTQPESIAAALRAVEAARRDAPKKVERIG